MFCSLVCCLIFLQSYSKSELHRQFLGQRIHKYKFAYKTSVYSSRRLALEPFESSAFVTSLVFQFQSHDFVIRISTKGRVVIELWFRDYGACQVRKLGKVNLGAAEDSLVERVSAETEVGVRDHHPRFFPNIDHPALHSATVQPVVSLQYTTPSTTPSKQLPVDDCRQSFHDP
ncbi:hypothetical protein SISSUDRAFT_1037252 [Sistotremastrum suecicum HHB10207 ss-3]|uniref:Secreted protein n=1 Tax=Sistotremastrum suecicum HHB10207 ss-3 TaxID=1314776 RepID=A0A165YDJ2_9AGAM|nr:hypothetical protein SISSUDRAFT_1037252 [Sistotremastrum suecicum HHB10207 ss-3]